MFDVIICRPLRIDSPNLMACVNNLKCRMNLLTIQSTSSTVCLFVKRTNSSLTLKCQILRFEFNAMPLTTTTKVQSVKCALDCTKQSHCCLNCFVLAQNDFPSIIRTNIIHYFIIFFSFYIY